MNEYGVAHQHSTGIRSTTLTAISFGLSSVLTTMTLMLITMMFTTGNSTAVQKLCSKKYSTLNMSSFTGMIISHVGRNSPHTTTGAAAMLQQVRITQPKKMPTSMTDSRTDTASNRRLLHLSFLSMRTVTATSA